LGVERKRMLKNCLKYLSFTVVSVAYLLICTSCGKHEASAGAVGAGAGAVLGAEVSGKNDKGLGALVGAITGNYLGRKIGRIADQQEEQEAQTNRQLAQMRQEQRKLKKETEKMCPYCRKQVEICGANTCPFCGTGLVVEKYCRRCSRTFEPLSPYQFCPSCIGGIRLASR